MAHETTTKKMLHKYNNNKKIEGFRWALSVKNIIFQQYEHNMMT